MSLLNDINICINLKTSWDSKKSILTRSIFNFNLDLIKVIKLSSSIEKFIFFSGLGTEKRSTFRNEIISKTEDVILNELENSFIIRPSIILGNGDKFLSNLTPLFKMSFFLPLFGNGSKKFQPVLIDDIERFISKLISKTISHEKLFELAGPDVFTYKKFYSQIAEMLGKKRVFVPIPMQIVKLVVKIAEKTPISPINSEQLALFQTDNILNSKVPGFDYFNMIPKKTISAIKKSL